jgi:hypothetical protein
MSYSKSISNRTLHLSGAKVGRGSMLPSKGFDLAEEISTVNCEGPPGSGSGGGGWW